MKGISKQITLSSGQELTQYCLSNKKGMEVEVLSLGAILTKIMVPDADGNLENVVLEWQDINTYEKNPGKFGATMGRVAGRISDAKVILGETTYQFAKNDHGNTLHGGLNGFDRKTWDGEIVEKEGEVSVVLSYLSRDGEGGFPGNLQVKAIYTLKEDNSLTLTYEGVTDKQTIVNLTNHSYFNLSGQAKRSILAQELYIDSDKICELDKELIPSGRYLSVDDEKAFDFRLAKTIGRDINEDNAQLKNGGGYDHCWILNEGEKAAELYDPISKRCMTVSTNAPGIVIYTMNFATEPILLANGKPQEARYGICFEAQKRPIGKNEVFKEAVILNPGEVYRQETIFRFSNR